MKIDPIEKCPQCGGKIEARAGVGTGTWMACKVCGARGPAVYGDAELAAVAWARKIQVEVKVLSPQEGTINWRQGPEFSAPLYLGGQPRYHEVEGE